MFGFEILLVLLILTYCLYRKRSPLRVPGPSPLLSLPCVGHGYLLGTDPINSLFRYRKKYGDVFRLDIGCLPTVFLCGWKLIEDGLKADTLAGRPYETIPAFKLIRKVDSKGHPGGVSVNSTGKIWQEQRKFMIHHLNDLGMGSKETMENIISQEAEYLAERIKLLCGANKKITLKSFFLTAINNVIWRIATGKRTKQDDPELMDLTRKNTEFFQALDPSSVINLLQLSSIPFLRLSQKLGIPNVLDTTTPFYEMLERQINEKKADATGDYIERLWAEVEKNEGNKDSSFHGKDGYIHIVGQMFDFFVAGTDTVSTFLEWSVLYMCQYEELQERLHEEIKECFGTDGAISLRDNFRLPLLEATIQEISRHSPMAALLVPHATVADVDVGGQFIPKGTQVFFLAASVHMDPALFNRPEEFKPERFLTTDGLFQKNDKVLFFGGHQGKRKCVGETLGRAESFLFLATLLQKFKFSKVNNGDELDFTPMSGLIFYPRPFQVLVQERN